MNKINKTIKYKNINLSLIILATLLLIITLVPIKTRAAEMAIVDENGKWYIPASCVYGNGKWYKSASCVHQLRPPAPEIVATSVNNVQVQQQTQPLVVLNPAPIVYSTTPDAMNSGKGKLTATINGANFMRGSVVKWNSYDRETRYIDSNHLTVKLTAEDMAGSGEYLVTVFNPAPGGGFSNGAIFALGGQPRNVATRTSENNAQNGTSALTANVFGVGNFMPRSLLQWIFFIILILLGILLWRKIYQRGEPRNAPLKKYT
jgi:hypothetical protein